MGERRLGPHTYVRLTVVSLWENLPLLILAGVVFCLLAAPTALLLTFGWLGPALIVGWLTLPAAWAALLALEARIAADLAASIGVLFAAFPRFWLRSLGLGLVALLPLVAGLYTLPMLGLPTVPALAWAGLAADAFGLLLVAALYVYAFPLLVLHDLGPGLALRNALVLASRHLWNTLGLLAMAVLFGFAVAYLSSGLLLFLPPIWGLFVVNNCRMVVAEELDRAGGSASPTGADRG